MRNKRMVMSMMIMMLVCFMFRIQVKAVESIPYATSINMQTVENTKIYMYDNKDSVIISVIPKGDYVSVVGATDSGYYVVNLGGAAGFVETSQVVNIQNSAVEVIAPSSQEKSNLPIIYHENDVYTVYQTDYQGQVEEQYGYLIIESGFSESERLAAKEMYDYLPENVENYLLEHHLACIFTKDNHKYECVPQEASGYTRATYISGADADEKLLLGDIICYAKKPDSILHEIGHAVDQTVYMNNMADKMSQQQSFLNIYDAEAENCGLRKYYTSQAEEYFAECFRLYLVDGEFLQEHMPQTYAFMENMIEKM